MIFQSKESKLFVGIGNDELACVTKIEISSERGLTSAGDVDKTSAVHTVTVDGIFGSGTAASVKAFQTLDNIAVTGKVDSLTWNRLYSRYAGIFGEGEIFPGISMKSGMSGATVKSAQVRLKYLIPNLVADGNYGPNTKSAVQSFQICQRLTADGVLGKTTWDALYSQVSD